MKITEAQIKQMIKEELQAILGEEEIQEQQLGRIRPPRNSSAGRPTLAGKAFGFDDNDMANMGKYHMTNGYLAFVDENGKKYTVNLIGPNGEAYYYADHYEQELQAAGYVQDENLTVPHPGQRG